MTLGQIKVLDTGGDFRRAQLELRTVPPSKKNKLRPRASRARGSYGRAHMYDAVTKSAIESVTTQLRIQWGTLDPLVSPNLTVQLRMWNGQQDRDGILTTLLDCMKTAGVIVDDSAAAFNGTLTVLPAEFVPVDRAGVTLSLDWKEGTYAE